MFSPRRRYRDHAVASLTLTFIAASALAGCSSQDPVQVDPFHAKAVALCEVYRSISSRASAVVVSQKAPPLPVDPDAKAAVMAECSDDAKRIDAALDTAWELNSENRAAAGREYERQAKEREEEDENDDEVPPDQLTYDDVSDSVAAEYEATIKSIAPPWSSYTQGQLLDLGHQYCVEVLEFEQRQIDAVETLSRQTGEDRASVITLAGAADTYLC